MRKAKSARVTKARYDVDNRMPAMKHVESTGLYGALENGLIWSD